MEYNFSSLKKKTVINVSDGKKLGKISDLTLSFPLGKVTAYTVTPTNPLFCEKINLLPCDIEKIGEDTILVRYNADKKKVIEDCDE